MGEGILGVQRRRNLAVSYIIAQMQIKDGRCSLQSPSTSSTSNRRVKSLSTNPAPSPRSIRFPPDCFNASSCAEERSKRVSSPCTVGRKNGAASGAFGGSFGLFRCYYISLTLLSRRPSERCKLTLIVSRLRRVCHLLLGSSVSVNNPPSSCSGET